MTPIKLPKITMALKEWKPQINYKSLSEITAAMGYFDPTEKGADFAKPSLFLTRNGQSNYFSHNDYFNGLFLHLQGRGKYHFEQI